MTAMLPGDGKTVLLLGGYGAAGIEIAKLLVEHTGVRLIVAGRDASGALATASELNSRHGAERVEGVQVDATDPTSLTPVFERCDLVTVCAPLPGIQRQVMEAALEAQIDYVALNVEMMDRPDLSSRVERAGLRFVTDAGIVPGVPAALARWGAGRFDRVRELTGGLLFRDPDVSYGSAIDMVGATAVPSTIFEDGAWRPAPLTATRAIDFGEPFGTCTCYPLNLPELQALPEQLGLDRASAFAAGMNPVADALFAVWYLLGLARFPSAARLGARLFVRATHRTRPPLGVALTLELQGDKAGRAQRLQLRMHHSDGYIATAIPTVSCIEQVLDETVPPGLCMMGHGVDPSRLVEDMRRLGMPLTETVASD